MFEPGQRVVWLKSSALQRDAVHKVPAIVLGDDGWGRVQIEAYHANGGPVRRWVHAERLRARRNALAHGEAPPAEQPA